MKSRTAYIELIMELERGLETLNDKSIPEQRAALFGKYNDSAALKEMYTTRTFSRAVNEVLGVTRKARQRRQDNAADLFNEGGSVEAIKS